MITSEQLRAARAMLRWEREQLAEMAGVPAIQVEHLELMRESLPGAAHVIEALQRTLEQAGIIFMGDGELVGGGPGVRLVPLRMDESSQHANDDNDEGLQPDQLNAENDG